MPVSGAEQLKDLRPPGGAAHDFAEGCVLVIGQPGPVFALRQEKVPEAFRLGLLLQFFHEGQRLPTVTGIALLNKGSLVGVKVSVHEGLDPRLKLLGPVGKFKKHGCSPLVINKLFGRFALLGGYPHRVWPPGLGERAFQSPTNQG